MAVPGAVTGAEALLPAGGPGGGALVRAHCGRWALVRAHCGRLGPGPCPLWAAGPSYVPTVGPCMPTAQEGLREGPRLCADSVCLEVSEHSLGLGLGSPRLEEGQAASDPQLLYSPQWF